MIDLDSIINTSNHFFATNSKISIGELASLFSRKKTQLGILVIKSRPPDLIVTFITRLIHSTKTQKS